MNQHSSIKTITEPAREIKVCREADVVVVGGGPGGVAAAVAAARNGADTVLIERYGHLGGMATGGLVNIIPNLADISGKQQIAGLCQELIDRLDARDATSYPRKEAWGSTEKTLVNRYLDANLRHFYVRHDLNIDQDRVLYTVLVDPEIMKDELNDMVSEAGVKLYLHSWGTRPIMDGNRAIGVFFESKSGRQAVLAKVVIDSTGDGDLLPYSGAKFDSRINPKLRIANLCQVFWLMNVDIPTLDAFKASQPGKYAELMQEIAKLGGFTNYFKDLLKDHPGILWCHPHVRCSDQADVEEMTRVDVYARKKVMVTYDFLKKHVPGFKNSSIMQTAPQLGTTGGRRVVGEYTVTEEDVQSDRIFEDTIAIFANNASNTPEVSAKHPTLCIPYRCLVPRGVEALLVACRAFSSEDSVNDHFNLIPHCICFGQAAGTAAALAARTGVGVRDVEYTTLHKQLIGGGVILPTV